MSEAKYYSPENPGRYEYDCEADAVVVGGGMAGTACAVTAARLGLKTILIQNRYCLGGPASAECDSDADGGLVCGAAEWYTRDARETGVIEDMRMDGETFFVNGYRAYWSQMLRDLCEAEENLTLLLNTEVYDLKVEDSIITSLSARTIGSDLTRHIRARAVIDCSGDSFPGFKAGADFRMGREARKEFNERLAPEESDTCTLGSSLYFRAVDTGHPVKFVPPKWAHKLPDKETFRFRPLNNITKGYWWLECGGDMNTISDNEAIYHELLAILYGIWDHIKNYGDYGAENYAINWIAGFPGKRESRRLMGDYILTESDILNNRTFPDGVAYGGGNVDIHPIKGFFSGNTPCGPEHGIMSPGLYQIPLRSLYSRNIGNLLMAGRNISVSHVALSSTRLMATCSVCGQAAAGAAFLMKKYGISPREVGQKHIDELKYLLYRVDHTLPGVVIDDPDNLCRDAAVKVSSTMPLHLENIQESEPLTDDREHLPSAQSFLSSEKRIESAFFRLNNPGNAPVQVRAWLVRQVKMYEFTEGEVLAEAVGTVRPGMGVETEFAFHADTEPGVRYYIRFEAVPGLEICSQDCYLPGVFKARMKRISWPPNGDHMNLCCRFIPEQRPFEGENLVNTHNRGGDFFSAWISDPAEAMPQTVDISFPEKRTCACVELVFETNLDTVNIHSLQAECIRRYRLEGIRDGQPVLLEEVTDNHRRFRRHVFQPCDLDGLRLTVLGTNGAPAARLYQIRAYRSAAY